VIGNYTSPYGSNTSMLQIVNIGADGTLYAEDINYTSGMANFLGGLNAFYSNGSLRWHYPVNQSQYSCCDYSAVIDKSGVIYFSFEGGLYALNPDGMLKWSNTSYNCGWVGSIAIGENGNLYCVGNGLLEISAVNGTMIWVASIAMEGGVALSKDGIIFVGSGVYDLEGGGNAGLFSFYPNGTSNGNLTGGSAGIPPTPLISSNGIVYYADPGLGYYEACNYALICLEYKISNYNATQYLSGVAMSSDGTVYFADGRYLYALGSNTS
jgi:hypothetical protein